MPVEVCGVKFIHPFYTLDSPTPCVAGYDLICAAKLVIDPIRRIVWSYWHVDLYATPPPRTLPTPHTMSADAQPTVPVSTTAHTQPDCHRMLCVDSSAVEPPSTESPQRPCASQSPRAPSNSQSPRARIPSPRACTLHYQHPRTNAFHPLRAHVLPVLLKTPKSFNSLTLHVTAQSYR